MKKRKQKGDCKTMKMKKFIAVVSMVGMLAAMPVAGSYRAIDFVLSNMTNSHIQKVACF